MNITIQEDVHIKTFSQDLSIAPLYEDFGIIAF